MHHTYDMRTHTHDNQVNSHQQSEVTVVSLKLNERKQALNLTEDFYLFVF
jgi:hypothetical protein